MIRCEKWAITWSHFGDTQYGGKNEENMWKKAIETQHSFQDNTKYEKNAETNQYGADFLIVFVLFCCVSARMWTIVEISQGVSRSGFSNSQPDFLWVQKTLSISSKTSGLKYGLLYFKFGGWQDIITESQSKLGGIVKYRPFFNKTKWCLELEIYEV